MITRKTSKPAHIQESSQLLVIINLEWLHADGQPHKEKIIIVDMDTIFIKTRCTILLRNLLNEGNRFAFKEDTS